MKKAKREMLSRPICDMGFQHLKEFKMARYESLESPVFVIIEERPKKYFTEEEWQHIINLRYHGTTGAPHPKMLDIMTKAYPDLCSISEHRLK